MKQRKTKRKQKHWKNLPQEDIIHCMLCGVLLSNEDYIFCSKCKEHLQAMKKNLDDLIEDYERLNK